MNEKNETNINEKTYGNSIENKKSKR